MSLSRAIFSFAFFNSCHKQELKNLQQKSRPKGRQSRFSELSGGLLHASPNLFRGKLLKRQAPPPVLVEPKRVQPEKPPLELFFEFPPADFLFFYGKGFFSRVSITLLA